MVLLKSEVASTRDWGGRGVSCSSGVSPVRRMRQMVWLRAFPKRRRRGGEEEDEEVDIE